RVALSLSVFSCVLPPPPGSTLFPYTTLFRSRWAAPPSLSAPSCCGARPWCPSTTPRSCRASSTGARYERRARTGSRQRPLHLHHRGRERRHHGHRRADRLGVDGWQGGCARREPAQRGAAARGESDGDDPVSRRGRHHQRRCAPHARELRLGESRAPRRAHPARARDRPLHRPASGPAETAGSARATAAGEPMTRLFWMLCLALAASLATPGASSAEPARAALRVRPEVGGTAPPPAMLGIGVDERVGARLPLEARFVAGDGRSVRLGELVGNGKPALLVLAYNRCS